MRLLNYYILRLHIKNAKNRNQNITLDGEGKSSTDNAAQQITMSSIYVLKK